MLFINYIKPSDCFNDLFMLINFLNKSYDVSMKTNMKSILRNQKNEIHEKKSVNVYDHEYL